MISESKNVLLNISFTATGPAANTAKQVYSMYST